MAEDCPVCVVRLVTEPFGCSGELNPLCGCSCRSHTVSASKEEPDVCIKINVDPSGGWYEDQCLECWDGTGHVEGAQGFEYLPSDWQKRLQGREAEYRRGRKKKMKLANKHNPIANLPLDFDQGPVRLGVPELDETPTAPRTDKKRAAKQKRQRPQTTTPASEPSAKKTKSPVVPDNKSAK